MALEKRGVQHIKTIAGLVDGRRARTSAGALLELSMLEMEKQRLVQEMQRAERRCAEIQGRLTEIEAKQHRLHQFVEKPHVEAQMLQGHTAASPLPVHSAPSDKLKRRKLSY
jgi:predicted nuclease with TOPRIM domain